MSGGASLVSSAHGNGDGTERTMKISAILFGPLLLGGATGATVQLAAPGDEAEVRNAVVECHDAGCRHQTAFDCSAGHCPPGSALNMAMFCRDMPFELPGCR
jgi:hypothetical protein